LSSTPTPSTPSPKPPTSPATSEPPPSSPPHPGEFRRLAKPLSITHDPTNPDERPAAAEALAQRLGCIAVLKGQNTVVSNGLETWTCQRGHPCLATAGTGDVLTGVIASLIAQYVAPGPRAIGSIELPKPKDKPLDLYDAARLAVEIHALAGERWAEQTESTTGLKADELADLIPVIRDNP
jgi:NAD(P)H-hydrate repair Nnr-like enzyme with NAD(P)H-hydrate dehydratase domain